VYNAIPMVIGKNGLTSQRDGHANFIARMVGNGFMSRIG